MAAVAGFDNTGLTHKAAGWRWPAENQPRP